MAIQKEVNSYYHSQGEQRYRDDDPASSVPLVGHAQRHSSVSKSNAAGIDAQRRRSSSSSSSPSQQRRASDYLRSAAQVGILACMCVYAFGQVMYLSPLVQEDFVALISPWFGIAVSRSPDGVMQFIGGHWEYLRPMFFVVWAVAPLLASLVLFELARDHSNRRTVSRFVMRIGAFMRRKPRVFGRMSPFGYGELLFQVLLFGGNVALFWYGWVYTRQFIPLAGDPYTFDTVLEISGIVFGYSCVFNMAFLFLPSTRNCAWMEFLNISYTNGVKYHRWLGVMTLVTGVAHAVPFYWWWGRLGVLSQKALPCFDCSLDYLSPGYPAWFNVFGELSLFFLLLVGVTSIPWVRRKMFETFYYTHHLYILGVVFAVMHWVTIIWWLLPSLVLYLISRSVSTWNALQPVRVVEFTSLPDAIIKIVIARSTESDGDFQIGQFVYLNVPAISRLQWHAFTIASAPRSSATTFTILLKSLGDWTRDLVELAEAEAGNGSSKSKSKSKDSTSDDNNNIGDKVLPAMFVDGYYGSSLESYEDFSTLLLVGGGIGVTPLFAILEDIVAKLSVSDRGSGGGSTALLSTQRVHFVFSFRELSLLEEVHPVLTRLRELDPHGRSFSFSFFLTRTPSESVLSQRIDCGRFNTTSHSNLQATSSTSQSFAEPLRSRSYRIAVYVVMLLSNSLIVLWLEYGGGRLMQSGSQWWPLENFAEVSTLFVLPVLVFAALAIEKWRKSRGSAVSASAQHRHLLGRETGVRSYSSIPAGDGTDTAKWSQQQQHFSTDVVTLSDLVSEYGVTVGERPDMKQIVAQVHQEFAARTKTNLESYTTSQRLDDKIGIFISGPEALKSATERVVSDLGAHLFDIHEEEFEL